MMLSILGTQIMWYVTRSSGFIALLLLTMTVVLGVSSAQKVKVGKIPRVYFAELHRSIALFALVLLAIHIFTAVVDPFTKLGWTTAFDPFGRTYRPLYLGIGVTAFDLLLAILVTSLLRDRLKQRTWKKLHFLSYVIWVFAVVHGLGTGTDSHYSFALAIYGVCLLAVVISVWVRILDSETKTSLLRFSAYALTLFAPFLLVLWTLSGPAKSSWSRRFVPNVSSSHVKSVTSPSEREAGE